MTTVARSPRSKLRRTNCSASSFERPYAMYGLNGESSSKRSSSDALAPNGEFDDTWTNRFAPRGGPGRAPAAFRPDVVQLAHPHRAPGWITAAAWNTEAVPTPSNSASITTGSRTSPATTSIRASTTSSKAASRVAHEAADALRAAVLRERAYEVLAEPAAGAGDHCGRCEGSPPSPIPLLVNTLPSSRPAAARRRYLPLVFSHPLPAIESSGGASFGPRTAH
jgi:hypothetical protein